MKKLMVIAALGLMAFGCGRRDTYRIEGNIANLTADTVYLRDIDGNLLTQAPVINGTFTLRGEGNPMMALLDDGSRRAFVSLFLEPGRIAVTGDRTQYDFTVRGTVSNDNREEFERRVADYESQIDSARTEEQRNAILEQYQQTVTRTISDNRDNIFGLGLYLQNPYSLNDREAYDMLQSLPQNIKQTEQARHLLRQVESRLRTDVGETYIDIDLKDRNGKSIPLSTIVGPGKYVLVDFWATWCSPCMAELPHLREAYEKYHAQGLEIYGVSLDTNMQKWRDAIDSNNMNWIQVINEGGATNSVLTDYAITTIPSSFLIGPDGRIVARNLRGRSTVETIGRFVEGN